MRVGSDLFPDAKCSNISRFAALKLGRSPTFWVHPPGICPRTTRHFPHTGPEIATEIARSRELIGIIRRYCMDIAKMCKSRKSASVVNRYRGNGAQPVGQGQGQAWLDHFGGKVDFPRTFRKFSSDFFGLKSGHADVFRGKIVLHVRTTAFFSGKTGMVTAGGASRGSESRGSTALRHERPRASLLY